MGTDLSEFLRIIRRRGWIAVLAAVLIPAGAVYYSVKQTKLYQSDATVLLSRQNLAATISGIPDYSFYDPSVAQTQAELAKSPEVAEQTLRAAGTRDLTAQQLLGETQVIPQKDTDLLTFIVTDGSASRAMRF